MSNKIKSKYYRYHPGEFMPIVENGQLVNKREFHAYRFRRAVWMIKNYRLVINHLTHQAG